MTTITDIRVFFEPYYEGNDRAHGMSHVDDVFHLALHVNESMGFGIPPEHVALMAYGHDMFTKQREEHHTLAKEWFLREEAEVLSGLTDDERRRIAYAVGEHRATYTGEYYSEYSELLSTADRGRPKSVMELVERSYLYGLSSFDADGAIEHAIAHVKSKFGGEGYARYPSLYEHIFGEELKAMRSAVDALELNDEQREAIKAKYR